jgi:hypothetical protein
LVDLQATAEQRPAGSDTPPNKVLRVIRPHPAEQSSAGYHTPGNNFKYEYFREFEKEFNNILGYKFGDYIGSIHEKN